MCYQLISTRILYQNSRFSPVPAVQLLLKTPESQSDSPVAAWIREVLSRVNMDAAGDLLTATKGDSPVDRYCRLVLGLQTDAGHQVAYYRAEADVNSGHAFRAWIEYEDHATALYAAELAVDLLNAVAGNPGSITSTPESSLQQLEGYLRFAHMRRPDPNTRLLNAAAKRLDIPVLSLDQPWGMPVWPGAMERSGVVQYGWGVNQRRCKGAFPLGSLSAWQLQQLSDRAQWLPRLKNAGLPTADQDLEFINRNQLKRAQRSARRIGYPVILRPRQREPLSPNARNQKVYGPIHDDGHLAQIFERLRDQAGMQVWVESYVAGKHYRFLVLDHEVVSVLRSDQVLPGGEGKQNAVPATGLGQTTGRDASCNIGNCTQVFGDIPLPFLSLATAAAKASGLGPVAGVNLVIKDLNAAAEPPNCAVVQLEPAPDLAMHSTSLAAAGSIEAKYFELLFPPDRQPRIPVISVTGTNGKTTTCRMVTEIAKAAGFKTGLSCSDGIYIGDQAILHQDSSGVLGANELLSHPLVEIAILETARGNMAKVGIAFDRCEVGAVLNIAADHLGQEDIETLEQMAVHKRQVIERTRGTAVLNAEDPLCLAMRPHTAARSVILTGHSARHPAIESHVAKGGRGVVLDSDGTDQSIAITEKGTLRPLLRINQIPATFAGQAFFNTENALAATAIALGLGISERCIQEGLHRFNTSIHSTPGRMNLYEGLPFRLIVDHAHNAHGLNAFCQFIEQQEIAGKKIAVLFSIADRSDQEIQANAEIVSRHFDYFFCREPRQLHDRKAGEITQITRSALLEQGIDDQNIQIITDPETAIDQAISIAKPGDLLVIFVGHAFHETIQRHVDSYRNSNQ